MSDTDNNWERQALEKVALAAVQKQRKSRQWGIFFKSLTSLYLFILLFAFMGWMGESEKVLGKHTALIDMQGVISSEEISADIVVSGLQSAFEDKHTKGVILRINSPGGSPVQAGLIYDEIKRLRAKYPSTPLYVVVDDICASGGYYVAVIFRIEIEAAEFPEEMEPQHPQGVTSSVIPHPPIVRRAELPPVRVNPG